MGKQDGSLVIGSLSADELTKSIDKLVNYVGNQTTIMADQFKKAMELMKGSMKDFAITQKVSVDLMKQAWRSMSESFDAMVRAQERATSSSGKGKQQTPFEYKDLKATYSVGELRQMRSEVQAYTKTLEEGSAELRRANTYWAQLDARIKAAMSDLRTSGAEIAKVLNMPERTENEVLAKIKAVKELKAEIDTTKKSHDELNNALAALNTRLAEMRKCK